MKGDLGTQIKTYINWILNNCDDPVDELEYIINLIIDSEGKEKYEIIDVLQTKTK